MEPSQKHNLSIYTVPTFNKKLYFVCSPPLAAQVHRASKTLSFNPMLSETCRRLAQFDSHSMEIIETNMEKENGNWGAIPVMLEHFSKGLAVGAPNLLELTSTVLSECSNRVNQVSELNSEIYLFEWIRRSFTIANLRTYYGPNHFMATDPELEPAFWEFQSGVLVMMSNFFPSLVVPKAVAAREKLFKGLTRYFEQNRQEQASDFIKKRYKVHRDHGLSVEMCARSDAAFLIGILVNATPTVFWLVANIFSRSTLLEEIRAELDPLIEDVGVRKISVESVQKNCPLLLSTYRETLRHVGIPNSTRLVLKDTVIGDRYLLKKGSVVQVATGAIHADKSIWGPDAAEFNPRRFMASEQKGKAAPSIFTWGGGVTLCPGRHYAMTEILGLTAAMVLSLDLFVDEEGKRLPITRPPQDDDMYPAGVTMPVGDVRVRMVRRDGVSGRIAVEP